MILHNSSHSWSSKGEIAAHKFALEQTITGTFKKHNNPTTSTNKATKKNPGKKPQQKDHTHRLLRLYNSKRKKKQFCYVSASPLYLACSDTQQIWLQEKLHK